MASTAPTESDEVSQLDLTRCEGRDGPAKFFITKYDTEIQEFKRKLQKDGFGVDVDIYTEDRQILLQLHPPNERGIPPLVLSHIEEDDKAAYKRLNNLIQNWDSDKIRLFPELFPVKKEEDRLEYPKPVDHPTAHSDSMSDHGGEGSCDNRKTRWRPKGQRKKRSHHSGRGKCTIL